MSPETRRTAVITGAASGLGLEAARLAAEREMNLVLVDVDLPGLEQAADQLAEYGTELLLQRVDVSQAEAVEALAREVQGCFGVPHLVFNNAGVGAGGLVWESSAQDWAWVLGVNLMGVVHGVRAFTPLMLAAERADPDYEGHIVNTASMAGLLNPPNMGVYNASKHAVTSLTETLYQDLALVSDRVHAHLLCPYFVPTRIHESERHRPAAPDAAVSAPTRSQQIGRTMLGKAVTGGKVSAATVAEAVFDAIDSRRFYVFSHPQALGGVRTRMDDILGGRNPSDPFLDRPQVGEALRAALRAGD